MSKTSEKARSDAKEKVKRLTERKSGGVDASGWTEAPAGFLNTAEKLGNRPISPQNLATGGKAAHKHSGRKSRSFGGPTPVPANSANVAMPPQSRFQFGQSSASPLLANAGIKRGGKVKRAEGGMAAEISGTRPTGGRIARKDGGSAKKGMNVNIIIAQKPDNPNAPPPGAPTPPPKPPMPMMPPGGAMPPPGGSPAGPMPGGPSMPPPSMARAAGGKVYPDMKYGAGSGEGRLEKIGKA